MKVYADNAAMKPLLPEVKQVIRDFLDADIRNPSAIYSDGRKTKQMIEAARATVAKAIGADPDEIYFTSGSTEAINWAFRSRGEHIITTKIEHKAILKQIEHYAGCVFDLSVNRFGVVDMDDIRNISEYYKDDCVVVIGYVNNEIGTIQPLKEIVDICHKHGSEVFCDATQALGNLPINVHELGVDYLCGSAQKLGGLAGTGFLYVKKDILFDPIQLGGAQERGKRGGTENVLGIVALAKAIEVATKDKCKTIWTEEKRDEIIEGLLKIPHSHLNGGLADRVCNNINIAFEGIEAESLVLQCDMCGLAISAGASCNSASIEPSHVLKAIGLSDNLARASIRITIGDDITDEEVEFIIKTVTDCVAKLRSMSPAWKEIENESN